METSQLTLEFEDLIGEGETEMEGRETKIKTDRRKSDARVERRRKETRYAREKKEAGYHGRFISTLRRLERS